MIPNTTNSPKPITPLSEVHVPFDPKYSLIDNYQTDSNHHVGSYDDYQPVFSFSGYDSFIRNKEETINLKISLLYDEIKNRYNLKTENIYQINIDQCECNNMIFSIGEEIFDKRRLELERKILDLEQEKRREEASFFRDVSFLNKELRYTLIEKLEEKQKANLMLNQEEELPCNI